MILAIDVGNTNIVLGGVEGEKIYFDARLSSDRHRTADEYMINFKYLLDAYGVGQQTVTDAIISSVVPPLTNVMRRAVRRITGKEPLIVGPGVKTGLSIRLDDPSQLGSDMVVLAVAAEGRYPLPLVIVDMDTATSFAVIDSSRNYRGGILVPGVTVSHDALIARTSQLPKVSLEPPARVIGRNTVESLRSGMVLGTAAMVDGVIDRIEEELGEKASVVATGDIARVVIPHCRREGILFDNHLLVKGLWRIYEKNRLAKKK